MDKNFVKKFLRGSASTSLGTLATVVFHFVSISLMTRFVDQRELGLYFLILAIANGGKILGSLGLDLTLVKFMSSEDTDTQQRSFVATIGVRLVVMAVLSAIMIVLGSVILPIFDPEIVDFTFHIPLLFILMSFRELFFYLLQGLNKYGMYAAVQTSSAILKAGLILLVSTSLDLTGLIYIEFAMLIFSMVIQFIVIPFRELMPAKITFDSGTIRAILRFGFPLYINSFLTYVSNFGGTFIVGLFLTPISIAAYEVAAKIPQGANRLFQSFSTVYFPTLSSLFAKDDVDSARKLINKSLVLLASGTFVTTLGALLFSKEIVVTLFSEQYIDIQPTFVLLMFSICLQLLSFTMGYSLVAAGVPEKSTRVNIVAMGAELVMSVIFVPLMGYIGVAVSFIIQSFAAQIMSYIYLRNVDIKIDLNLFSRPFLILGVTSFAYLLINSDLLIIKIIIFSVYVALNILFIPDCRQAIMYVWNMVQQILTRRQQAQVSDQNL